MRADTQRDHSVHLASLTGHGRQSESLPLCRCEGGPRSDVARGAATRPACLPCTPHCRIRAARQRASARGEHAPCACRRAAACRNRRRCRRPWMIGGRRGGALQRASGADIRRRKAVRWRRRLTRGRRPIGAAVGKAAREQRCRSSECHLVVVASSRARRRRTTYGERSTVPLVACACVPHACGESPSGEQMRRRLGACMIAVLLAVAPSVHRLAAEHPVTRRRAAASSRSGWRSCSA